MLKSLCNIHVLCVQVKEMCRRELERLETDNSRNTAIIHDYKQVGCDPYMCLFALNICNQVILVI